MATYKVWFTVRDGYGNIKEVEGGAIDVDLTINNSLIQEKLESYLGVATPQDITINGWENDING